ncbi:hypothetical protein MHM582_3464 [Microbacterium sp. HM58-2]|nr:hypothetical protein MHM582_3464 [Microbacterium sp. HM58-2]
MGPVPSGESVLAECIAEDIWAVKMPLNAPSPKHTLTYVVRDSDGGAHVIDPGWDTVDARPTLLRAMEGIGLRPESIRTLILTHAHRDHFGFARDLRAAFGAEIVMSSVESENLEIARDPGWPSYRDVRSRCMRFGVPQSRVGEIEAAAEYSLSNFLAGGKADQVLEDGDALAIPGRHLTARWTPGHTAGHLCFVDEDAGIIFTGDHVLPGIHPGYGLGGPGIGNPLRAYLSSLEAVKKYDDFLVAPGHEYVFRGIRERATAIGRYHLGRVEEVREQLQLGIDRVWDIASRVTWSIGFETLTGNRLRLALEQIAYIVDFCERTEA